MARALEALSAFVESHPDTALLFPVHPNPAVTAAAAASFRGHPRIQLVEPLPYRPVHPAPVARMAHRVGLGRRAGRGADARQTGSDSQGEHRTFGGRRVRHRTARRFTPGTPSLATRTGLSAEFLGAPGWERVANPFGDGQAGRRIVGVIENLLCPKPAQRAGQSTPSGLARPTKAATGRRVARQSEMRWSPAAWSGEREHAARHSEHDEWPMVYVIFPAYQRGARHRSDAARSSRGRAGTRGRLSCRSRRRRQHGSDG